MGRGVIDDGELASLDDVPIAGASAEVTAERLEHLLARMATRLRVERGEGHQDSRGAEPALEAVLRPERVLDRTERPVVVREAFDRPDVGAVRLDSEHQAGSNRGSVDFDGAGAAH